MNLYIQGLQSLLPFQDKDLVVTRHPAEANSGTSLLYINVFFLGDLNSEQFGLFSPHTHSRMRLP